MKAIAALLAMCGFTCLNLTAGDMKKPYAIRRGDETLTVSNMPASTVSEPITNSFVLKDSVRLEHQQRATLENQLERIAD
jgi:hypothetical protein